MISEKYINMNELVAMWINMNEKVEEIHG